MLRGLEPMRVVITLTLVLTTLFIVVLAFTARTVRQYGDAGQWGATTATDGIRWWQGWALLCILATWVVLLLVAWLPRPRWWLLLLPVFGFVAVASNAAAFRRRLLDEDAGPRTYEAQVPLQLPPLRPFERRQSPVEYEVEAVTRVYDLRIPSGIEAAIVGCWVAIGLLTLLMILGILEDSIRRARRADGQAAATMPRG